MAPLARWTAWLRAIAALLYESAVALPLLMIVDGLDPDRAVPQSAESGTTPPCARCAALALYPTLRFAVLGVLSGTMLAPGLDHASAATRVATAIRVWPEYLRLLIYPRDLVADYGPNVLVLATWRDPIVWLSLAIGVLIITSAVVYRRRAPWWTAAVAWFIAGIFIVSNLVVPVGILLAERNLYLPSIALAFAAVPVVALLERRRTLAIAIGVVVFALGTARTWTRTPVWRSTTTVLADGRVTPESFHAQSYLGDVAMRGGKYDEAAPLRARVQHAAGPIIGESCACVDKRNGARRSALRASRAASRFESLPLPHRCAA